MGDLHEASRCAGWNEPAAALTPLPVRRDIRGSSSAVRLVDVEAGPASAHPEERLSYVCRESLPASGWLPATGEFSLVEAISEEVRRQRATCCSCVVVQHSGMVDRI